MNLEKVKLFRMTHVNNVPHILKFGIIHKNSQNANTNYQQIGDISLIRTRNKKKVIISNGEPLKNNTKKIVLGNYIPFYFWVRMPMLYVVQMGGNFVERAILPEKIVYIVCSLKEVIKSNGTYYFSDGHATDNLTTFYDKHKIFDIISIIDWDATKVTYWGGSDNLDVKRKKQAEFIVSDDIPISCIVGFICYNNTAKTKLINYGIEEKKIKILPKAYFE